MTVADSQILAAIKRHGSQRKAAAALGIHSRTVERRLAKLAEGAGNEFRLLVIDIETRPILAYVWGLFKQYVSVPQIVHPGGVLCFAARWVGEETTQFYSEKDGYERMIRAAHRLLSEADAVVGWNSQRFDVRWLERCFRELGLPRVSVRHLDLMKSIKKYESHPSYKLEFHSRKEGRLLGEGGKVSTGGFQLWTDVMAGDAEAWKLMEEYNRHDVDLTLAMFRELHEGGWIHGLPNHSVSGGDCCPNCGSERLQFVKYVTKQSKRYRAWVCMDCGAPSESCKAEPGGARLKAAA